MQLKFLLQKFNFNNYNGSVKFDDNTAGTLTCRCMPHQNYQLFMENSRVK